jgi:nucleoside-diphosphate-sugar epimerase
VARALIIGCGCRGRELGGALADDGWQVRGTTREQDGVAAIELAGIEPALADPAFVGSVFDLIEGVSLVFWLLGSARGEPDELSALHGARLETLLEKLVDTPVRGFVYEAAGTVGASLLRSGALLVTEASERWRIPVEIVEADPNGWREWRQEMLAAADRALGG